MLLHHILHQYIFLHWHETNWGIVQQVYCTVASIKCRCTKMLRARQSQGHYCLVFSNITVLWLKICRFMECHRFVCRRQTVLNFWHFNLTGGQFRHGFVNERIKCRFHRSYKRHIRASLLTPRRRNDVNLVNYKITLSGINFPLLKMQITQTRPNARARKQINARTYVTGVHEHT